MLMDYEFSFYITEFIFFDLFIYLFYFFLLANLFCVRLTFSFLICSIVYSCVYNMVY